ncbi:MAG: hypothetical protein AAF598_05830 [Bacteroidota bacterium]
MRKKIINLVAIVALIASLFIPQSRFALLQTLHDLTTQNPTITTKEKIKNRLKAFPIKKYKELNEDYLTWSKSNTQKYKPLLQNSQYRVIQRKDFYQKIVGDFRIHHFICKDSIYRACLYGAKRD